MADREQDTQPKGKDKDGKPAKPVKIPVPKRADVEDLLRKASKRTSDER